MSPSVYVKLVGFKGVERDELNSVFKQTAGRPISYGLWTAESRVAPHVALVDMDAFQSGLELVSPDLNSNQKMICIGKGAPAHAWRTFERPLYWPDVIAAMDSLFARSEKLDDGIDFGDSDQVSRMKPSFKKVLLVDPIRESRMYLRARLALAGHAHVEDAETAEQALEFASQHHCDLVIMSLDLPDMEGWALVRQLVNLEPAIGHVVVTTPNTSRESREYAEYAGCLGLLEKPFNALPVIQILQKI
jgi:CheY-like chemotaxis protein